MNSPAFPQFTIPCPSPVLTGEVSAKQTEGVLSVFLPLLINKQITKTPNRSSQKWQPKQSHA